jgi:hypothetical protein
LLTREGFSKLAFKLLKEAKKLTRPPEHVLLDCPLWRTQRDLAWPEGATRAKQLWGSADELKRTVKFIEDVGLNV